MPPLNSKNNNPAGLSPKEELFCSEYVSNGFVASRAAESAGYSKKTSASMGSHLLSRINIQNRIDELKKAILKKNEITAEEVVRRLAIIARQDIRNVGTFDGYRFKFKTMDEIGESNETIEAISTSTRRVVGSKGDDGVEDQEVEFKFHDKVKALELLGKYFKLFSDDKPSANQNDPNKTIIILPSNGF